MDEITNPGYGYWKPNACGSVGVHGILKGANPITLQGSPNISQSGREE